MSMTPVVRTAAFIGGSAAIGAGAYALQQRASGHLHDEQTRIDAAIAEQGSNPATVELLRTDRPSDFDVNFDKSLVLGGLGVGAASVGAFMLFAGGMSTIPEVLPGTRLAGMLGIGLLGGTAAGVLHNTLGGRFDQS